MHITIQHNTVFYDFKSWFLVIFCSNCRHRIVLKISFPKNLEIPYQKSSFPVHQQILRPTPPPSPTEGKRHLGAVVGSNGFQMILQNGVMSWRFYQNLQNHNHKPPMQHFVSVNRTNLVTFYEPHQKWTI